MNRRDLASHTLRPSIVMLGDLDRDEARLAEPIAGGVRHGVDDHRPPSCDGSRRPLPGLPKPATSHGSMD